MDRILSKRTLRTIIEIPAEVIGPNRSVGETHFLAKAEGIIHCSEICIGGVDPNKVLFDFSIRTIRITYSKTYIVVSQLGVGVSGIYINFYYLFK